MDTHPHIVCHNAESLFICERCLSLLWLFVRCWLWWWLFSLCMAILCPPWCCDWRGRVWWLSRLDYYSACTDLIHPPKMITIVYRLCIHGQYASLMYLKMIIWQCDPYFDNSGCSHPGCEPGYPTPKCTRKCVNKNLLWRESKRFSVSAYRIHSDPYNIMAEVYKNGPVEVAFTVYEVKKFLWTVLVWLVVMWFCCANPLDTRNQKIYGQCLNVY